MEHLESNELVTSENIVSSAMDNSALCHAHTLSHTMSSNMEVVDTRTERGIICTNSDILNTGNRESHVTISRHDDALTHLVTDESQVTAPLTAGSLSVVQSADCPVNVNTLAAAAATTTTTRDELCSLQSPTAGPTTTSHTTNISEHVTASSVTGSCRGNSATGSESRTGSNSRTGDSGNSGNSATGSESRTGSNSRTGDIVAITQLNTQVSTVFTESSVKSSTTPAGTVVVPLTGGTQPVVVSVTAGTVVRPPVIVPSLNNTSSHPTSTTITSGAISTININTGLRQQTTGGPPSVGTASTVRPPLAPMTVTNRRIVIKSANGEQFAISLQPTVVSSDVGGASLLIASSQSADVGGASYINTSQSNDTGSATSIVAFNSSCEQHSETNVVEVSAEAGNIDSMSDSLSICLVCGDKGSGFHYSVYSCEGCKGFFKRTVQKNMTYVCKENGVCQINKITRNSCQHCRFRRCLDVGMKKEAVREDRTPGGKHRAKRFRLEDGDYLNGGASELQDWNTGEDESLITQLVDARPDILPECDESHMLLSCEDVDMNEFIQISYNELQLIIDWAKRVPGFTGLILEDQMSLLKSSFMELIVLRLAYRSIDCEGAVRLTNSMLLSPSQCTQLGWCEELISCSLEFLSRLRCVSMDHTEFCVLTAVILTYPDAAGLLDRAAVVTLHNSLLDCLYKYSTSRYPDSTQRCHRLLLRLPSLRTISAKAAEKFLSCSLETDVKMSSVVSQLIH